MVKTENVGLGSQAWWSHPVWLSGATASVRAEWVLTKLLMSDTARLRGVLLPLFKAKKVQPSDIGRDDWQTILRGMGASDDEVSEVISRLGLGRVTWSLKPGPIMRFE